MPNGSDITKHGCIGTSRCCYERPRLRRYAVLVLCTLLSLSIRAALGSAPLPSAVKPATAADPPNKTQQQKQQQNLQPTKEQQRPQVPVVQQQLLQVQPQQQQRSNMAPLINGWSNLVTTANVVYTWSHQLVPIGPTSMSVPWGFGSAVTQARGTFLRSVASAQYSFSGNLQVTNPDPAKEMWLSRLQLQCFWGSSVTLPCGNNGWQYSSMVIRPGQTNACSVSNVVLQASFGSNFRQPCRVTATAWNGGQATSGDFVLDFSSPNVNNQANNCLMFGASCAVAAAAYYSPIVGGAPQGRLVCEANANVDFDVAINGGFLGDGLAPGSCGTAARIDCQSQAVMQTTIGTPSAPGSTLTGCLSLTATPINCPAPPPPPSPPPLPTPNPGFQDRPEPQLSIAVTKSYIAGVFAWSVANTVTPSSMQVYLGSSSMARYSVPVTRTLSSSPAPKYLVDGVITVTNPSNQAMSIQAVNALLPWNAASPATCSNLNLPGILNPGASANCNFRLNYELGPKPNSVSAQAVVAGRAAPTLSPASAPFNFDAADLSWSSGSCAGVVMAFKADAGMQLQALPGGRAPAFAGAGMPATQVCSSTSFDFTASFAPDRQFKPGATKVYSKVTVSPVASSQGVQEASSTVDLTVLEWPAAWGPRTQQVQQTRKAGTGPAAAGTAISPVSSGWFDFDWDGTTAS
ncbi:hypothetical protein COO60DRAFT_567159 [Scenedesmus sp. NREL 46B-D3]|nr:hypothetical protein COO60DRAFT_567159 [Scenedesmus sp. NREL 46B-D3]